MRAQSIWVGDTIRYRGKRYDIHGIIKLYGPPRVRVIATPKGAPYVLGQSKWKEIPGDHTVILEYRKEY